MSTPKEIFDLPAIRETHSINSLKGCYYSHIPEIDDQIWYAVVGGGFLGDFEGGDRCAAPDRITIKEHGFYTYDGCRIWRVSTVWLDGKPVMITRNAGREGDDFYDRFIVDDALYRELIAEIFRHAQFEGDIEKSDRVSMDEDIGPVFQFYGKRIRSGEETPYRSLDFGL